jgi:hypothetical protein
MECALILYDKFPRAIRRGAVKQLFNPTEREEDSMFAVVRHYHFDPKNGDEIDRAIRDDFVPLIKKAKEFIRYYWLETGKGEGASVSVFKDKAGADESVRLAADYIRTHMAKLLTQKPEIIEGPVRAHD